MVVLTESFTLRMAAIGLWIEYFSFKFLLQCKPCLWRTVASNEPNVCPPDERLMSIEHWRNGNWQESRTYSEFNLLHYCFRGEQLASDHLGYGMAMIGVMMLGINALHSDHEGYVCHMPQIKHNSMCCILQWCFCYSYLRHQRNRLCHFILWMLGR